MNNFLLNIRFTFINFRRRFKVSYFLLNLSLRIFSFLRRLTHCSFSSWNFLIFFRRLLYIFLNFYFRCFETSNCICGSVGHNRILFDFFFFGIYSLNFFFGNDFVSSWLSFFRIFKRFLGNFRLFFYFNWLRNLWYFNFNFSLNFLNGFALLFLRFNFLNKFFLIKSIQIVFSYLFSRWALNWIDNLSFLSLLF